MKHFGAKHRVDLTKYVERDDMLKAVSRILRVAEREKAKQKEVAAKAETEAEREALNILKASFSGKKSVLKIKRFGAKFGVDLSTYPEKGSMLKALARDVKVRTHLSSIKGKMWLY